MRLAGEVAIVSGAAQGIGASIARRLGSEGAKVIIADVSDGQQTVEEIRAAGGEASSIATDVSKTFDVESCVQFATDSFGPVSILVNNAGLFASLTLGPITNTTDEELDAVMRINIGGMFKFTRAAVPAMIEAGRGKIVNIGSSTSFGLVGPCAHYVMSKSAVLGFTRTMARELGAHGISVNAIAPGFTESKGVMNNTEVFSDEMRAGLSQARCFARPQSPDDVAGAVVYLASGESDFVTGQCLVIDGGEFAH